MPKKPEYQWISIGNDLLWLEGSESDVVAAFQAFAGLRYHFNPRMGLGLMYRFLSRAGVSQFQQTPTKRPSRMPGGP